MKKIALTLIAVSALGLAACNRGAGNNATNEVNSTGEAVEDTNGATDDMHNDANGVDATAAEANGAGETTTANDAAANDMGAGENK